MSTPLSVQPVSYGPIPWDSTQGGQSVFTSSVVTDPTVSYSNVSVNVQIFDGNNNLVRTLGSAVQVAADGTATAAVAWDGKDSQGNKVAAGDYAPTFTASGTRSDGAQESSSAILCSGVPVAPPVSPPAKGGKGGSGGGGINPKPYDPTPPPPQCGCECNGDNAGSAAQQIWDSVGAMV